MSETAHDAGPGGGKAVDQGAGPTRPVPDPPKGTPAPSTGTWFGSDTASPAAQEPVVAERTWFGSPVTVGDERVAFGSAEPVREEPLWFGSGESTPAAEPDRSAPTGPGQPSAPVAAEPAEDRPVPERDEPPAVSQEEPSGPDTRAPEPEPDSAPEPTRTGTPDTSSEPRQEERPETGAEPPGPPPEIGADPGAESQADAHREQRPEPGAEPGADRRPESQADAHREQQPEPGPATGPEPRQEQDTDTGPEPEAEQRPEPEALRDQEPDAEPRAGSTQPEPRSAAAEPEPPPSEPPSPLDAGPEAPSEPLFDPRDGQPSEPGQETEARSDRPREQPPERDPESWPGQLPEAAQGQESWPEPPSDARPESRSEIWSDRSAVPGSDAGPGSREGAGSESRSEIWSGRSAEPRSDARAESREDAGSEPRSEAWSDHPPEPRPDARPDAPAAGLPETRTEQREAGHEPRAAEPWSATRPETGTESPPEDRHDPRPAETRQTRPEPRQEQKTQPVAWPQGEQTRQHLPVGEATVRVQPVSPPSRRGAQGFGSTAGSETGHGPAPAGRPGEGSHGPARPPADRGRTGTNGPAGGWPSTGPGRRPEGNDPNAGPGRPGGNGPVTEPRTTPSTGPVARTGESGQADSPTRVIDLGSIAGPGAPARGPGSPARGFQGPPRGPERGPDSGGGFGSPPRGPDTGAHFGLPVRGPDTGARPGLPDRGPDPAIGRGPDSAIGRGPDTGAGRGPDSGVGLGASYRGPDTGWAATRTPGPADARPTDARSGGAGSQDQGAARPARPGDQWPPPEPARAAPVRVGPDDDETETAPKKSRRTLLVTLIAVVAVIGIGAGVVFGVPGVSDSLGLTNGEPDVVIEPPAEPVRFSPVLRAPGGDAPAPTADGVQAALAGPAAAPALGTLTGIVMDPASGQTLWQSDPQTPLVPASTGKLLTSAAALLSLDHTAQLVTQVVEGPEPGSVVIVGGGDPTLSSLKEGVDSVYPGAAHLSDLVEQVRASGTPVRTVHVDLGRYQGESLAPGWLPADVGAGYISPMVPAMLDGGRSDAQAQNGTRTNNPARVLAEEFATRIGATVPAEAEQTAPEGAKVLGEVRSAPLVELVDTSLRTSDNVLAEAVAREVAKQTGKEVSFAGGAEATLEVLAQNGFDLTGVELSDGSGLSTENRVPARLLAEILNVAAAPDGRDPRTAKLRPMLGGLPVAGGSGTLDGRYQTGDGAAGKGYVRAKTGTLSGVNSLAGVVLDQDGRVLVFALMTANTDSSARPALDAMAAALRGCGCQ